jgi:hypothetical protein
MLAPKDKRDGLHFLWGDPAHIQFISATLNVPAANVPAPDVTNADANTALRKKSKRNTKQYLIHYRLTQQWDERSFSFAFPYHLDCPLRAK